MSYTIERVDAQRDSSGNYRYHIYEDARLIAHYWHDHRGDEHGIEFVDGASRPRPVGRMADFIEGGGPEPLTLSAHAVAYLRQHGKA